MKRFPQWIMWSVLTVGVWSAAGWYAFGSLQTQQNAFQVERDDIQRQKRDAMTLVAATPRIMAQLDSVEVILQERLDGCATIDKVPQLLRELKDLGSVQSLYDLEVRPELQSVMDVCMIPPSTITMADACSLDTIQIQFQAAGKFQSLGAWLDAIEDRHDFQRWKTCRWENDSNDEPIRFFAEADFWIVVAAPRRDDVGDNR